MKQAFSLFLLIGLLAASCKNNPSAGKAASATTDTAAHADSSITQKQELFPIAAYIGGELKIIDSLQLPLSITVTVNDKAKSAIATDATLRYWAHQFQDPDISSDELKSYYRETSIADESVPSVTLIYTATKNSLPLQKANVYVKPSASQNDKVTSVYLEKLYSIQDTIVNQKLYWKSGKNLQVVTEKKVNGKSFPVEQVKITWNPE